MTKTNASWKRKQVSSFKKTNALITTTECAPPFSVQSLKVVSLLQHPQLRLHEDLGVGSSVLLGWMSDQTMFMVINLCVHKYEWQKPCYKLLYLLLQKSRTPRWGHKVHRGRGNTRALHRGQISKSVSESGDIETEHRPSVAPERVQIHCLHVELCLLLREYLLQAPHHQMLWRRGGMVSSGSSQVAPLVIASVEELRKCVGGWAWSDLCLAAVHREMTNNTQLNIDKLKHVQDEINNA